MKSAQGEHKWFEEWFDSEYYHTLYKRRNQAEAETFVDNLILKLKIPAASTILDIPCGKGRHSIYLNKKGFHVRGVDLSENSIKTASQHANSDLSFAVHDMRKPIGNEKFDFIFNLFTSFGYFDTLEENLQVLNAFKMALKKDGKIVIDFFNTTKVLNQLIPKETVTIGNKVFDIRRFVESGVIVKEITVQDAGKVLHFEERVRALTKTDFLNYFEKAGLHLMNTFGDYQLHDYLPDTSERMIFVLERAS